MAYEYNIETRTFPAGADLSSNQFYYVTLNASAQVIVCTAATDIPIGVLQNKPDAAGKAASVAMGGTTKVICAGAVAIGDLIGTDAAGKADPKIPGTDTTEYLVGIALETGAADEIIAATISTYAPARAA